MYPTGFGPAFPASEPLQTHALDRMATEIDTEHITIINYRAAISVAWMAFIIRG